MRDPAETGEQAELADCRSAVPMARPTVTAMATLIALCSAYHSGSCRWNQRTIDRHRFPPLRPEWSPGSTSTGESGMYQQPPTAGPHDPSDRPGQPNRPVTEQQQPRITELVPQVALGDCRVVGPLGQLRRPATASTSNRWDASGLCQPVINPSTTRTPRHGSTTSYVQPVAAAIAPSCSDRAFQGPGRRGAHRDHPAARPPGRGDQLGGRRGHLRTTRTAGPHRRPARTPRYAG